ncbi:hypothetical protein VIC_004951 [Vibrio coralliilyticus ATCC BAA-450]|nr:hypothetical protein VIC_004951 [Vibrio coralliilyticus ATCC BAA-450]QFT35062.1 hypothetical protein FIU99_01235 [Vibrio sp. THAF64]QGM32961.1 hypothetical protein GGC04_01240 [Vibrio sp. THAF191d]QGN68463.1 hypothetical protein GGC03_01235 [Vibrio sp. THAF191c]
MNLSATTQCWLNLCPDSGACVVSFYSVDPFQASYLGGFFLSEIYINPWISNLQGLDKLTH